MDSRSRAIARHAIKQGRCPWCGSDVRGALAPPGSTTCPRCGNDWGQYVGPRDPGSPRIAALASILALVFIVLVAALQQFSESPAHKATGPQVVAGAAEKIASPSVQLEVIAKVSVKVHYWDRTALPGDKVLESLDPECRTPEDRFRAAIVAGDLLGEDAAKERLEKLQSEPAEDSPLGHDVDTLKAIYAGSAAPADVDLLVKHHHWFGSLAATYGLSTSDPDRLDVIGGGGKLIFLGAALGLGAGLLFLVWLVLLIVAIVMGAKGKLAPAFRPPAPGGSVAIETVAIFVGGFIVLKLVTDAIDAFTKSPGAALAFALVAQWSLILLLFWPVMRGVSIRETMALWGLHRGRGVLREIACGIAGYITLLPLLIIGIVVSVTLMAIYQGIRAAMHLPEPAPLDNPILDILGGKTSIWLVALIMMLASLWAPLVEESIFRGALYRHLRSRWHVIPAGIVTALGFGFMHGYPVLLLGPVIALGFGFCLLREWRGSIIASMTAHCIHNTVVLCIVLTALRILG